MSERKKSDRNEPTEDRMFKHAMTVTDFCDALGIAPTTLSRLSREGELHVDVVNRKILVDEANRLCGEIDQMKKDGTWPGSGKNK